MGTFGRLWNGLRFVPLVGQTVVWRQQLKAFSMYHLIEQRIDNGRGYIRAALAASRDDIRRVPADEQLLRLDHVDKSDRHTNDERRRDNAFLNQLMQTDERSRRIADGEEERGLQIWRHAPSKRLPA